MRVIGFVFAMKEELQPYLDEYKWLEVPMGSPDSPLDPFTRYCGKFEDEDCLAIVSGIGKVNAMIATAELLSMGATHIINIGSCGARMKGYQIGDVVLPTEILDGDFDLSAFGKTTKNPYNLENKPGIRCYTFSKFVETKVEDGDYIVDMEAYGVASMCQHFDTPFTAIKVISDNADETAAEDNDTNVSHVMEKSIDLIKSVIKEVEEDVKCYV